MRGQTQEKRRYFRWYYGLNTNISFTFQAIKNLPAHLTYLSFGLFCNFFGDFWVYLGINSSFLKELVEFMKIIWKIWCCFKIGI